MLRRPTSKDKNNPQNNFRNIDDTYVLDARSGLYKPKAYAKEEQRNQEKPGSNKRLRFFTNPKRDWITIIVSFLTLVVVGAYTEFARRQWKEAQRTANAADQTVKEAQKQTAMLHQQLSESLGAIVFLQTYFEGGHSGEVRSGQNYTDFTFVNRGQVPAAWACVEYEIHIDDVPRLHKYVLRRNHFESPVVLKEPPPGQGMPEDEDQKSSHRELFSLTEEQIEVLNHRDPTTHALVVEGSYEYWNGFDEKKTAPFCRVFSTVVGFAGNGESCSSFDSRWKKQ